MTFKAFIDQYDNWNGTVKITDNNLDTIVEGKISSIMDTLKDLYDKDVASFGFYDGELTVLINTVFPKQKTKVKITMEKTMRISKEYNVTEEQLFWLKHERNPFFKEMEEELEHGTSCYDYTVCDENGRTIVGWE